MLEALKQKISEKFVYDDYYPHRYQTCQLFDLIQQHLHNDRLEGEEIANIIIVFLFNEEFLQLEPHYFGPDEFYLRKNNEINNAS
jgi:hypothetical protein